MHACIVLCGVKGETTKGQASTLFSTAQDGQEEVSFHKPWQQNTVSHNTLKVTMLCLICHHKLAHLQCHVVSAHLVPWWQSTTALSCKFHSAVLSCSDRSLHFTVEPSCQRPTVTQQITSLPLKPQKSAHVYKTRTAEVFSQLGRSTRDWTGILECSIFVCLLFAPTLPRV